MNTKYSLTTLLNNLLKLQNNSYQIITKLSDVVSSNSDTVEVDVIDGTGTIQKVYVPSYGSIKNQIIKLENDVKSISGIGDTNTSVQLSDGTFRKILVSSLQKEAADIQSMSVPTQFKTKENWFFESFLNPLLYISFNLTGQVRTDIEKIEVSRYILNLDTQEKIRIFNNNFQNKADIKFADFVQTLLDNGISYFLDNDLIDMPARTLRYSGNFTVTNIVDDTIPETVNGSTVQKRILRVQLDKLIYNDSQSRYEGTQQLKIGDSLVVNSSRKNTRYEITGIDSSTRSIIVKLVEGFDPIVIGRDILSFYGEDFQDVSAEIKIGFNEHCVIFIKPVDPDSKIQSVNWSPGVGVYTSNLTIVDPATGKNTSLSTFYQNEVVDFGSFLYSSVKDKTPPSIFGIVPDSPALIASNFKVLQINQHLTSASSIQQLEKLQSDKLRVQSQISVLDKAISELRSKIQTTRYSSQKLQDTDNNSLSKLINERSTQSSLYSSIIDDITKISASENVDNLTPKYRLRGFFPIPTAKTSDRTNPQEVVQFIIQYRYVKKDGSANQPQQLEFVDNDGQTRRGTFSTWNEYKSEVRRRRIDANTGIAFWAIDDVESAESVNINQIDLAIQQGEGIEFRVKSLSEAGWPVTPLESAWSNIIRVDFPAELESKPNPTSIVEQAKKDSVKVELQSELTNLNLDKVSSLTLTQGGKFYTADSTHIASGFLTPENNIVSLFEKLTAIDNELNSIRSLIANAKGSMSVRIVDEQGQEITVEKNSTVRIFAGNYRDQVASLPVKKGVIITKNYFIKINNEAASVLELYSRVYGSKYSTVNPTWVGGTGYMPNDIDYNRIRRYDFVPVGLSNPDSNDISNYGFIRPTPEQSQQVRGQFINSRYTSIDGNRNLYNEIGSAGATSIKDVSGNVVTSLSDIEWITSNVAFPSGDNDKDFIWGGQTDDFYVCNIDEITDYSDYIYVHRDHPVIQSNPSSESILDQFKPTVRNSKYANIPKGDVGFDRQNSLYYTGNGGANSTYAKVGFEPNDQFLLGPKSVGAYLFLNPNSHSELIVDGADNLSLKQVKFGNPNSLTIPVTFQYRMTDYYGIGSAGLGNVGGILQSNANTNLEYTKTIGIDIYLNPLDGERFSFDLELTSRYYSKSLISKDIPARSFETALDDLAQTIKIVTPRTSRDTIVNQGGAGLG